MGSTRGTGANQRNAPGRNDDAAGRSRRRDKGHVRASAARFQKIKDKHREEMAMLNSELVQRKQEIEKQIEIDHGRLMGDLRERIKLLQRQCKEVLLCQS